MSRTSNKTLAFVLILTLLVSLFGTFPVGAQEPAAATVATITILHNNDFHGNLELSGSNPGMARLAYVVNGVRCRSGR